MAQKRCQTSGAKKSKLGRRRSRADAAVPVCTGAAGFCGVASGLWSSWLMVGAGEGTVYFGSPSVTKPTPCGCRING